MIYVFYPYWSESTYDFSKSLQSQKETFTLITRNRKADGILWTKALRDFQNRLEAKDDDIICIMNNDIKFKPYLFTEAKSIKQGEIFIPWGCQLTINWKSKKFFTGNKIDSFLGRCFFMTAKDFLQIKFSRFLPHALADIDFGIRAVKKFEPKFMTNSVYHPEHSYEPAYRFSLRSYENPVLWTIFLLKHPNRWTWLNIIKSWL